MGINNGKWVWKDGKLDLGTPVIKTKVSADMVEEGKEPEFTVDDFTEE